MKHLWTLLTRNPDGSPLLGIPGAGPILIAVGVWKLVEGCFF